ncbi:hypothetical protein FHU33_1978 [Blastococcus colisei]|uniref:Uncharacterized protein n=2 Tax=Blastococcus colisei TaxID=1564162 RepID=A0A543PEQ8_9ACTN|nr:hypothetical protein FHU33_1978 [Blastococcus colisei]
MLVTPGAAAPTVRSALSSASVRWKLGWCAGGAVVVVSAGLLLTIIGYARRIARQADEITAALEGTRQNTAPLFDLVGVNRHLERILAPSEEKP